MNALDKIKSARSKEELADAVEPIALQMAIIAEETLPSLERLKALLDASGHDLGRIEALKSLERSNGRRGRFIGLSVGFLACLVVGIVAPASYKPLQQTLQAALNSEDVQQNSENWKGFISSLDALSPSDRALVLGKLGWQ